MADLTRLNFNPANVEEMSSDFELIPHGTYPVVIVDSDIKDTKAGNGKILELKYQIIEGPFTSKMLIDRLNIKNPTEIAEKIAHSNLKDICNSVGFTGELTESSQLHGKPFSVSVEVEEFESNTSGKTLQSNNVTRRMKKTDVVMVEMPPPSGSDTPPKQSKGRVPW